MFEKLIEIIKNFLEKYFIQSLIAIIPTIIIYYFTPDDFNFIIKIGKELYILFVFILCFLLLESAVYIINLLRSKIQYNNFKNRQNKKIEMENLKYLWNYVDGLSDDNKKLLKFCLQNNNKIININGYLINNRLLDEWFNQTQTISDGTLKLYDIGNAKESDMIKSGIVVTQYKLKDEIYEALVYSKNKYGKISNFE